MPADPSSALGRPRAVRIAYHNPDKTREGGAAKSLWDSLTWRGRALLIFTGMMEALTMDCLIEMVCCEVTVILKKGKQPRYLIGATAQGQADLRDDGKRPLEVEDLVFLRTDDHVRVWWLAGDQDLLDLLVVVRRTAEVEQGARDVTPIRYNIPMLPGTLFAGADDSTEVEEEGDEGEAEEEVVRVQGPEARGEEALRNEEAVDLEVEVEDRRPLYFAVPGPDGENFEERVRRTRSAISQPPDEELEVPLVRRRGGACAPSSRPVTRGSVAPLPAPVQDDLDEDVPLGRRRRRARAPTSRPVTRGSVAPPPRLPAPSPAPRSVAPSPAPRPVAPSPAPRPVAPSPAPRPAAPSPAPRPAAPSPRTVQAGLEEEVPLQRDRGTGRSRPTTRSSVAPPPRGARDGLEEEALFGRGRASGRAANTRSVTRSVTHDPDANYLRIIFADREDASVEGISGGRGGALPSPSRQVRENRERDVFLRRERGGGARRSGEVVSLEGGVSAETPRRGTQTAGREGGGDVLGREVLLGRERERTPRRRSGEVVSGGGEAGEAETSWRRMARRGAGEGLTPRRRRRSPATQRDDFGDSDFA